MNSLDKNVLDKNLGHEQTDALYDDEDDAPIPGTVFNNRQARRLKIVVIVMGIMLLAGFALLIGIIAYRATQPRTQGEPVVPAGVQIPHAGLATPDSGVSKIPRQIEATIPKDATYLGSTINGNRLVLTLQTPQKDLQLLFIDMSNWRIAGKAVLRQKD